MRRVSSDERHTPANATTPIKRVSSERHHRPSTSAPPIARSLSAQYPATPISSYYALNLAILHAFDSLYTQHQYEVAYAMGLQFIETALLEIPRHGYFYSKRHEKERQESTLEAERVCKLLEDIVGEEAHEERARLEKLAQLAREQRVATYQTRPAWDESWSDVSVCSEALSRYLCPLYEVKEGDGSASPPAVPLDESKRTRLRSKREKETVVTTERKQVQRDLVLEPSVEREARVDEESTARPKQQQEEAPVTWRKQPSVDFLDDESLSAAESADLERALFLSGLDVPTKAVGEIDIASLTRCYREDFQESLNSGRIRISRISTHQGRLAGSINGCTVIAPLLCIHHFQNDPFLPDPGLPDAVVEYVIDKETCGLLPQVRDKLGLTKDALIIPSDVHDFLLDRGLLVQQQFVTVCGGNILDEVHVTEMLNAISARATDKKIAATVFFHEHVICILKLNRGDGQVWFDFIDSLPFEDTLNVSKPFMNTSARSSTDLMDSDDDDGGAEDWLEEDYVPYAARIRCLDVDAMRATLRWYACSKFNEKDCAYIDSYAWDDGRSDFDPRVFQAFVWAEV